MSVAEPIRHDNAARDTYTLIRTAIQKQLRVTAIYKGLYRELCPHALGINKHGQEAALFYQFGGASEKGLGPPGSPENWRCLLLAELQVLDLNEGEWHTASDHSSHQTCVFQRLDLSID